MQLEFSGASDAAANAELVMQQLAMTVLLSKVVDRVQLIFGFKLKQRIEFRAQIPLDQPHLMRKKPMSTQSI